MEAWVGEGTQVLQMAGSGVSCPRCGLWCLTSSLTSMGRAKHQRVRSDQHPDQVKKYIIHVTGSVKGYLEPCPTWTEAPPREEMAGTNVLVKVPTTPRPLSQQGRTWSTVPSDHSTHMNLRLLKVLWKLDPQTAMASVCESLSDPARDGIAHQ